VQLGPLGLRNFATLAYTQGIGQESGTLIRLVDAVNIPGLQDLNDSELYGRHRLSASVEPVLFTPWPPLAFRAAPAPGIGRFVPGAPSVVAYE
jgi:hypothetical protein